MAQQHSNATPLPRNSESLRYVIESVRTVNQYGKFSPKQKEVYNMMEDFFTPELDEAMNYMRRLPSFMNCGGLEERRQLLRQEAELVILECIYSASEEQVADFEECIQNFRAQIAKRFAAYSAQVTKESFHVDVKKNKRTNENDQCSVVAHQTDISDQIGRETVDDPAPDKALENLERMGGQFRRI